jgi:predicted nuclease of predicted toxin-antitoxin system
VKCLVDAQLPRRLARWLSDRGVDAVHTLDLPAGNATTDQELTRRADAEERFVITKDDDFVQSFILNGQPARLWLISTGNIRNDALESLMAKHWEAIRQALEEARFIEMGVRGLIIRA